MDCPRDLEMRRSLRERARHATPARWFAAALVAYGSAGSADAQELPAAIRAPGETVLLEVHAEGAQIYECKAQAAGKLAWVFREPIASLFRNGETVGRHFAGPRWELADGSSVSGTVQAKSPGSGPEDIAWLRLAVASHGGVGTLAAAATVQRIDTQGGALEGSCETAGAFRSVPYSADYVFLKK